MAFDVPIEPLMCRQSRFGSFYSRIPGGRNQPHRVSPSSNKVVPRPHPMEEQWMWIPSCPSLRARLWGLQGPTCLDDSPKISMGWNRYRPIDGKFR